MNLFADIKALVLGNLKQLQTEGILPDNLDFTAITVELPRDPIHGEMATNAAMVLAKPAKMPPRTIAETLVTKLVSDPRIATADVAGPGFINLQLIPAVWCSILPAILNAGGDYGRSDIGHNKKVNVEYVSANPTGPLHIGHTRGAIFGDALANLLAFVGFDVTREYYINDGGAQVDVLARSVYLRYLEANGHNVQFEDGTYPGDYLIALGEALKKKHGDALVGKPEADWLANIRNFSIDAMMDLIRSDLALVGVTMDHFFSEKSLYGTGLIEKTLDDLNNKGLIYEGVLDPPKGKTLEDWEPRKQTLFKSTLHGDDVDRPIKKSDGSWTYFAPDIAYHYDKVQRGFDELIDIFGTDHGGYVKRMKAAVSALSEGKVSLDIKLTQLVKLFKNGAPYKMSKRAGTFITLRDLIKSVGADVTRFVMLTRKNDAPLDFDFDKVLEQSKDNPVFYVQYASARLHSVMEKAKAMNIAVDDASLAQVDCSALTHPAELDVLRKIAEWPRILRLAAQHKEPHRIAFYLYELASTFHSLWNQGKDLEALRFLHVSNNTTTQSKICLARAVLIVISVGFAILGITPMKEMH